MDFEIESLIDLILDQDYCAVNYATGGDSDRY